MNDETLVSFICPTHNRTGELCRLYESLIRCNHGADTWELIVVDSCGDAETRNYLADRSNVTHLHLPQWPFNLARAHNHGAEVAKGEVLCFVNDDVAFLCEHLAREVNIELARNTAIGLLTPAREVSRANYRTEHFSPFGEGSPGIDAALWCYGDAQFYPREVFQIIGGWDERLWGYGYTEADQCAKVLAAGYRASTAEIETVNFRAEHRNNWWGCPDAIRGNAEVLEVLYGIRNEKENRDPTCFHTYGDWLRDVWSPRIWKQTEWRLRIKATVPNEGIIRVLPVEAPGRDIPAPLNLYFDGITIPWPAGTIDEIDTPHEHLWRECRRVLKPGGGITFNGETLWIKQ